MPVKSGFINVGTEQEGKEALMWHQRIGVLCESVYLRRVKPVAKTYTKLYKTL